MTSRDDIRQAAIASGRVDRETGRCCHWCRERNRARFGEGSRGNWSGAPFVWRAREQGGAGRRESR